MGERRRAMPRERAQSFPALPRPSLPKSAHAHQPGSSPNSSFGVFMGLHDMGMMD